MTQKRVARHTFDIHTGKTVHSPHFSLRVIPSFDTCAIAVVVAKKVVGTAVMRNKLKRRMREALQETLPEGTRGSYIVYAKKGVPALAFTEILDEVQSLVGSL